MKLRRIALLSALSALAALGSVAPSPAAAGPVLNLDVHHNQTNFAPGGLGEYWFDVNNVGDAPTTGAMTLTLKLASGLTRDSYWRNTYLLQSSDPKWSCPGSPGDSTITCTTTDSIPRRSGDHHLVIAVDVKANLSTPTDRTVTATLKGGGSPDAPQAAGCLVGVAACATERTHIDTASAGFGILPDSFTPDFTTADGISPVRASGSHPALFTVPFDFNSIDAPVPCPPSQTVNCSPLLKHESEDVRDLTVDLPPGFLGSPTAVSECSPADFTVNACPLSSQVGKIDLTLADLGNISAVSGYSDIPAAVFNLSHPRGSVTDLGFSFAGNPVHIKASLDPANNYAIRTTVPNINETLPPFNQKLFLWGVPADPSHDSERCPSFSQTHGGTSSSCSTDAAQKPFLTVPFQCGVDNTITLRNYDSWQHPGVYGPDIPHTLPGQTTDCEKPRFSPDVSVHPTGTQANTPTGLDVSIDVPQNDNPNALATPPVKSTTVTLPQGMTLSPSFADGLAGCTMAQFGIDQNAVPNGDPVACPDNSRIGDVQLTTPLLPKPLEGSMYLAAQDQNPFSSTFALYMAIHDTEERGVLVKIPGKITLDQNTGQITTSFDQLPEFPFSDFTLSFRSGDRAPLINPPDCGSHAIGVTLTSYAQPDNPVDASNSLDVTQGPGGGACPPDAAHRPFNPQMQAGTINPAAAAFSPFIFRLTRTDADQELSRISTTLPAGLEAKLAGIPTCPEAAIKAIPTDPGSGATEQAAPHCPAASQVGTLNVGVGSGAGPNYFPGRAYLAGPYQGAPLSVVTVIPALAGPFDLGNVITRVALHIDPTSGVVTAVSDPLPTILQGELLRVRDIRLLVNPTVNPTSCDPTSVGGLINGVAGDLLSSADDSQASLSYPFQVLGCQALGFNPSLALGLKGGTKRNGHPAFTSVLKARSGDANIAGVQVTLPPSVQLDQSHIQAPCTRPQFAQNQCPAASVIGSATATSPLLDNPLSGNVYLRTGENPLPDVVLDLHGPDSQPIHIVAVGKVDTFKARLRTTFTTVPDAPLTQATISLAGGSKGLLVNNTDLCAQRDVASVRFTAHNAMTFATSPTVSVAGCKKAHKPKKHKAKHHKKHKRAHHRLHRRALLSGLW